MVAMFDVALRFGVVLFLKKAKRGGGGGGGGVPFAIRASTCGAAQEFELHPLVS